MRLVLITRRGSPVVHFAGVHNTHAAAFCGQLDLTGVNTTHDPRITDQWWIGSPTQAARALILDRRRPCMSCVRVFEEWAVEVDEAITAHTTEENHGHL